MHCWCNLVLLPPSRLLASSTSSTSTSTTSMNCYSKGLLLLIPRTKF